MKLSSSRGALQRRVQNARLCPLQHDLLGLGILLANRQAAGLAANPLVHFLRATRCSASLWSGKRMGKARRRALNATFDSRDAGPIFGLRCL